MSLISLEDFKETKKVFKSTKCLALSVLLLETKSIFVSSSLDRIAQDEFSVP